MNALEKYAAKRVLTQELIKRAGFLSSVGRGLKRVGRTAYTLVAPGFGRPKKAPILGPKGAPSIGVAPPKIRPR